MDTLFNNTNQTPTTMKYLVALNLEKYLLALAALISGIMVPITELLLFVGFIVIVDTVTGIWAAKKRGEEIHSSKMKMVLPKLVLYPLIIIVASWGERLLPEIPFIKGASVLLMAVEGKSILENATDIFGFNFLTLLKIYITKGTKGVGETLNSKTKNDDKTTSDSPEGII